MSARSKAQQKKTNFQPMSTINKFISSNDLFLYTFSLYQMDYLITTIFQDEGIYSMYYERSIAIESTS